MQTIGRYLVESRIGSGGLGVIYRARDPHLRRDVAIKVMSASTSREPDMLARFEREARTAAALAHRNIITVHEFGIHDGDPFIVMELLGGTDLDERLRSSPPLMVREKLSIAIQIAEALQFAHERRVVHRDLKPSNIRLLPDGTVKLMDFGLAYVPASTLTKSGELFGTVAFLAPEQLRGSKGDPRSDIYSFGVILFEIFEGRLPFEATSSPDLIRQILDQPAIAADWLPRHPELHTLVMRALEKEPEDRWQTAGEVLDALRGLKEYAEESIATIPGDTPIESEPTLQAISLPATFTPGTIAGGRYRIVALLGSGGMGEVYRADDLRLGQRVALKFLAPHLTSDPARLERLYAEVRVGRQVSHPNVCRIYDIGDANGHPFIAMQLIEGEDLASLLRRVGRLSLEKSLDIARDICNGLTAAHASGVVHRDLKPSNIMIDAQGRAILLDFGLAAVAEDALGARPTGSLHYASPEQLAGQGVSMASDLYSLGLVLYELLIGRRAFEGNTVAEVSSARASHRITAPSLIRSDVPAELDRVILRCLSIDPAQRPDSAREILAVLPGGDAVSAAIAAGETPSPEVIAAAGEAGDLAPRHAWTALIVFLLLALLQAAIAPLMFIQHLAYLDDPPAVLAAKARSIAAAAGYRVTAGDTLYELDSHDDYLDWLQETKPRDWRRFAKSSPPGVLHLQWRYAPRQLTDRPLTIPGELEVRVDSQGHLVRFVAVPPETTKSGGGAHWQPLLVTTGCTNLAPVAPEWTPPVPSDARRAWRCRANGIDLRIEAASFAGKPAWLEVFGPWRTATPNTPRTDLTSIAGTFNRLLVLGVIIGAGVVARRNIVRRRGDRRRAFLVSGIVAAGVFGTWLFGTRHVGSFGREWEQFVLAVGRSLFRAGVVWIAYMAAEPYVRRQWPRLVTSWYRFFDGRFRDPLVGRHVLFGMIGGATLHLIQRGINAPALMRGDPPVVLTQQISAFDHLSELVALLFYFPDRAIWNAMGSMIVLLLLRAIVRSRTVAALLWLFVITGMNLQPGAPLGLEIGFTLLFAIGLLVILLRLGLFPLTIALMTHYTFLYFAPSFDLSQWYLWPAVFGWLMLAAFAGYGFFVSLGGKPPFGRALLEE